MNLNTKPLTIVFCIPGEEFSNRFLIGWSNLLSALPRFNMIPLLSNGVSSNVYYARSKCLGGDVLRGISQKPFNGQIDYDYLMWIDSDSVFTPEQFFQLFSHKKDIVSGMYLMTDCIHFTTVEKCDDDFFMKNGTYQFMTREDVEKKSELFEIDYTGMGFMLMKRGVMESLKYPWFRALDHVISADIEDFSSEDASLCFRLRDNGYKIYVDPAVRVGHEKRKVL